MEDKYYVADSYKNFKRIGEPFTKSGKLYTKIKNKCDRCWKGIYVCRAENGQPVPHPAYNEVCLKCNGTGYIEKEVRLYTEKEKATLDRAAKRREEQRIKANEERIAKNNRESEENKKKWFAKNSFDENGFTYCVIGDSYSIKDKLKELGFKFDPVLKWHTDNPNLSSNFPEGYRLIPITFDEIMDWQSQMKNAFFLETAKDTVDRKFKEAEGPSESEYYPAEISERIRNITAIFKSRRGFQSQFGWTNIFTFENEKHVLVWFTTTDLDLEIGQTIDLTFTITGKEEFRGVKTTKINRCKIIPMEA
jgi:hypothetical protein